MINISHPLEYMIGLYATKENQGVDKSVVDVGVDDVLPTCITYERFSSVLKLERNSIYTKYPDLKNKTIDYLLFEIENDADKLKNVLIENTQDDELDVTFGLVEKPLKLKKGEKCQLTDVKSFTDEKLRLEYMTTLIVNSIFEGQLKLTSGALKGLQDIEPDMILANTLIMLYTCVIRTIDDVSQFTRNITDNIISIYSRMISAQKVYFLFDKNNPMFSRFYMDLALDMKYVPYYGQFDVFKKEQSISFDNPTIMLTNKNEKHKLFVDLMTLYLDGVITLDNDEFMRNKFTYLNHVKFIFDYKKIIIEQKLKDSDLLIKNNTDVNKNIKIKEMITLLTNIVGQLKSDNFIERVKCMTRTPKLKEIYDAEIKPVFIFNENDLSEIKLFYGNMDINDLLDETSRVLNVIANSYHGK